MVELEVAVHCWQDAFQRADINRHPSLWVGHFGEVYLFSFWNIHRTEAVAEHLARPFVRTPDITSCVIAVDLARTLRMTRIATQDSGARITNWVIPYSVSDDGTPRFGMASYEHDPMFPDVVDKLVNQRLTEAPTVSWMAAYCEVL